MDTCFGNITHLTPETLQHLELVSYEFSYQNEPGTYKHGHITLHITPTTTLVEIPLPPRETQSLLTDLTITFPHSRYPKVLSESILALWEEAVPYIHKEILRLLTELPDHTTR